MTSAQENRALVLLSPLGERLGEGVMQETVLVTPSPNLSPKGERNMTSEWHTPNK
jgi:hypothetical protein